jgi:RNA recognition motif-containing protein
MGKRLSKEEKNQYPSLYIDNLPKESFFDLDLYKFVSAKGYKLKSAKVVLDKRTSKSRGYGYL